MTRRYINTLFKGSIRALAFATLNIFAASAVAGTGTVATATELKSAPNASASTVSQLTAGSQVQVGERQGGWYKVTTPQGDGWVRMLNVRLASGAAGAGASAGSGLAALEQASRSNTTVATGIRGLSREELKTAQEDLHELGKLDQYTASQQDALGFGTSAGLPAPGGR
jgi:hypothetical protein